MASRSAQAAILILAAATCALLSAVPPTETGAATAKHGAAKPASSVPLPDKRPPSGEDESAGLPPGAATPAELRTLPANAMFAAVTKPSSGDSRPIGFYTHGCMAGGEELPINGPDWQVMRLQRNRNWGTRWLIDFIERFASDARAKDGWPGLLIGDMAQPRGGPMINGHASHQIGLDVDIWYTPMPDRILSTEERATMNGTSMLKDPFDVDPKIWTPAYTQLIKRAASYPQVARIFVHPAIKKVLCEQAGTDRAWLDKVRPWWGHYAHFHVRLKCPEGISGCDGQPPVKDDDGCGVELDNWFKTLKRAEIAALKEKRHPSSSTAPRHLVKLAALPAACKDVLLADGNHPPSDPMNDPVVKRALASNDAEPPEPPPTKAQIAELMKEGAKRQIAEGLVPLPTPAPHRTAQR